MISIFYVPEPYSSNGECLMYQKIDDPIFALYNCECLLSPALYHKYTNDSIHSTCIIKIVSILTVSISIIHNLPFFFLSCTNLISMV